MGTLTYADYAALPDDGHRYELIDGELVMTPSPGSVHQWVVFKLARILADHVETHRLGLVMISPLDVILSERNVPQPDIIYLDRERESLLERHAIAGAPTLAVEVLSPSRPALDRVTKRKLYREHGIPHYWIADPERRTLEGLVLGHEGYEREARFSGQDAAVLSPFPGLSIPLAKVWWPSRNR